MRSRGQQTTGCLPAWGLGELLTAPHRINLIIIIVIIIHQVMKLSQKPRNWADPLMRRTVARQLLFRLMMLIYWVNAYCSTHKTT